MKGAVEQWILGLRQQLEVSVAAEALQQHVMFPVNPLRVETQGPAIWLCVSHGELAIELAELVEEGSKLCVALSAADVEILKATELTLAHDSALLRDFLFVQVAALANEIGEKVSLCSLLEALE